MKEHALEYAPREQFLRFHRRSQRWASLVCHRRSGKTFAVLHDLLIGALECPHPNPQFAFVAPTYQQAKRIAWEYLKAAARPFLAAPPNETELRVDLINRSRIFLAGSDNADSLRGIYLDGAAMDEFPLQNPSVWTQIIRPALADRKGWGVLSGTPNGRNHFFDTWREALGNPAEWFTLMLKASESGIIPASELAALRRQMSAEEYEQEMEVSFDATSKGRILASYISQARAEGRISDDVVFDPMGSPIEVACDLGFRDTCVWWVYQPTMEGFNVLDCIHGSGLEARDWAIELAKTGYRIKTIWLPHDGKMKTVGSRVSVKEQLEIAGYSCIETPKTSKKDQIEAARLMARVCRFNATKCDIGLRHLENWTYLWNNDTQSFSNEPKHDGASHFGDAFAYGGVALYHAAPEGARIRPVVAHATGEVDAPRVIPAVGGDDRIRALREQRRGSSSRIERLMRGR